MGRIARITEDLGGDGGGFYVEPPDIPESTTCQEWRRLRFEIRAAEDVPPKPEALRWRTGRPRRAVGLPALRAAFS